MASLHGGNFLEPSDEGDDGRMDKRRRADIEDIEFVGMQFVEKPENADREKKIGQDVAHAAPIKIGARTRQPDELHPLDNFIARAGGVDANVVPLPGEFARE